MTNRTPQTPHYKNYLNEVKKAKKTEKISEGKKYKFLFLSQLKTAGLANQFIPNAYQDKELQFHPDRKWRFDFACEREKIAVELQGGGWGNVVVCDGCGKKVMRRLKDGQLRPVREGGRHQNPKALEGEYEKLNEAQRIGWRVFLFSPDMIRTGKAIELISQLVSPGPLETKD